MQVALVTGHRKIDLLDFPDPEPQAGKVVVDITYCGICGTDLHAYQSGEPYNPAICGHEWTGHASGIGAGVDHVKEGDRVAIGVASSCGRCTSCLRGDAHHCETAFAGAIGVGPMAAPHGGFASRIAFDASRLYQVPKDLTDEAAAILEPATVAVHALRRTPLQLGDRAVIIGGGPIGLLVLQCAKAAGAGQVVLLEPQETRREMALNLGADVALDPTAESFQELFAEQFPGGPDAVFECAGVPSTIGQSVSLVRRGGTVSLVGVANHMAEINPAEWLIKEVKLTSSIAYQHEDFEICKDLVASGRIQAEALHTSTTDLAGMSDAFDRLSESPQEVKILVDPR